MQKFPSRMFVAFLVFSLPLNAWMLSAKASKIPVDASVYESVTGMRMDEEKMLWDEYYRAKRNSFGKDPIGFLKDHISKIPAGRAFVPAMGHGRNAIFLAQKGFYVEGNDLSDVAVDEALQEANRKHVRLHTIVGDVLELPLKPNSYDFILVSLFYKKELIPILKKSLKKGGYLMFYHRVAIKDQLRNATTPDEFAISKGSLKDQLKDFQIQVEREYVDHGTPVTALLARKL